MLYRRAMHPQFLMSVLYLLTYDPIKIKQRLKNIHINRTQEKKLTTIKTRTARNTNVYSNNFNGDLVIRVFQIFNSIQENPTSTYV